MGKLRTVLVNFATSFVIAFAVGSYLRSRKTGLKAGLALGLVAVAAALLSGGKADELEELVEAEIDVESATTEQ